MPREEFDQENFTRTYTQPENNLKLNAKRIVTTLHHRLKATCLIEAC